MKLDGTRAEEKSGADFSVRKPSSNQTGDLQFLAGQPGGEGT